MKRSIGQLQVALEKLQNAITYINTNGLETLAVHAILGEAAAEQVVLQTGVYKVAYSDYDVEPDPASGCLDVTLRNLNITIPDRIKGGANVQHIRRDVATVRMNGFGSSTRTCKVVLLGSKAVSHT